MKIHNPYDKDIFHNAPPLTLKGRTIAAHVADTSLKSRRKRRWGRIAAACGFSFALGGVMTLILLAWLVTP